MGNTSDRTAPRSSGSGSDTLEISVSDGSTATATVSVIEAAYEALPAMSFVKDKDLRYIAANRAGREAFGLRSPRDRGSSDRTLFPADLAERLEDDDRRALASGDTVRRWVTLPLAGGPAQVLLIKAAVPGARDGESYVAVVAISGGEMIRVESRAVQAVLDAIGDTAVIADPTGAVEAVNAAFEQMTGLLADEVVGEKLAILDPACCGRQITEALQRAAKTMELQRTRTSCRDKCGRRTEAQLTAVPIPGAGPGGVRVVVAMRDLSDRRVLAEAARRESMLRSKLISTASHELRTPVTALKESLDLIAEGAVGELGEPQRKFIDIARRNADRLSRVVARMLDFGQLQHGDVRTEPCSVNELLRAAAESHLEDAQRRGLSLELQLAEDAPQLPVDAAAILTALSHLLDNAIHWTSSGGVTVRSAVDDHELLIEVSDTGVGMSEQEIDLVFEPFVQVGFGSPTGGAGLGLAICRLAAEMHGGRVWASSQKGVGSTFYLALPIECRKSE